MRRTYDGPMGTGIDPEEYAYPSGSITAGRRGRVYDRSDGKLRAVEIGVPDTYFSIPGRVRRNGRWAPCLVTVSGWQEERDGIPEGTYII